MDNPDDRIDLLLAAADDGRPVLEDGLSADAAQRGKKPKEADAGHWWREDDDPNDLAVQRWGVVAVQGRDGDRQIKAIQALIDLRAREQGAPVRIDRVPAGLSSKDAAAWKDDTYLSGDVKEEERPRYLLVLGDLHDTSADLQHVLAVDTFVGRIHFGDASGETDEPGYSAYAQKVVDYALTGTRASSPDLLFYVAEDGSAATITGKSRLVEPSVEASQGNVDAASVRALEADTVDALLAAGAGERPSVLLSVSHGLGAPKRGWPKGDEQWRRQGAMVVRHDEILDAERIRGRAFLPGGMWFFLACFGGGTPEKSAYRDWLLDLAAAKAFGGSVGAVLDSLAPQQPFVAAMPQAALANPLGPLAVIGHLDLAWTYGFSATTTNESRSARILEPLEIMVRGSRAGVALGKLMKPYLETNDQLVSIYDRQKNARVENRPDPTDPVERARLWMLRNDLRGYVLLGDPAARLPLRKNALEVDDTPRVPELRSAPVEPKTPAALPTASAPASFVLAVLGGAEAPREIAARAGVPLETLWEQVAAVLAMVRGDEAPRVIADRAGVPLDTLWAWVEAYRAERRQGRAG